VSRTKGKLPSTPLTLAAIRRQLRKLARPQSVPILRRFFKTGRGEYGEGDVFIGVKVPGVRTVCRECSEVSLPTVKKLLRSRVHEERLLALLILVQAFKSASEVERRRIYKLYLANTAFINNWDLVDASASQIVGAYLYARSKSPLTKLARSKLLWERRIAIIATFDYIRRLEFDETFRIADLLLHDEHDLIHKAVGWLLREIGKRDGAVEREFLSTRYKTMPRTMLLYAIERFPDVERRRYLAGQI
jgi:3-methyladenine DNA glycosylase AlkD